MQNLNPKISIITITYNAEKYIERTIKSIVTQTYSNIEYIIIDGKSTDKTLEIANKYSNKITKIISEPDKGLYDAMNKGIANATGDYLWFMNAGDEVFDAQTLEKAIKNSNFSDFIYGKTTMVDEISGKTRNWYKTPPPQEKMSHRAFINGMVICHQSMLVKRKCAVNYRTDLKVSADIDWCIRSLKNATTFYNADIVMCQYLEGGISGKHRKQSWKERFDILKQHFGLTATIIQHFKIVLNALKRGSVG